MFSYKAYDVNQALQYAVEHLLHEGVEEASRVGSVIVAPGPVCIEYTNPRNRVLFSPTRDANHVFHVMETLWMLSGSNEIEFPVFFNASYSQFSDDGKTMWDSYGWRWREFFGYDQLELIVEELKNNPTSRRCVLSMWNSMPQHTHKNPVCTVYDADGEDFYVATHGGKAVPCNTHAYFAIRAGKLNMTVMNRSNDTFWGCFGANAVHFSFLLEYMAMRIGVSMGSYYQFTNNLHAYTEKFSREKMQQIAYECELYEGATELGLGPALEPGLDVDLKLFMQWAMSVIRHSDMSTEYVPALQTEFMADVVMPMFLFWVYRKRKVDEMSNLCLDGIEAPDWRRACREWKERRQK
jgi:thymidylate synthase